MTSLFTSPQEKPLAKFLRATMTLQGGRTQQLREEAKVEYEQLQEQLRAYRSHFGPLPDYSNWGRIS